MPLDPALDGFLAKLDKEFDPPPHLLAATEFRALIERLSAEGRPERPAGLAIEDLIVSHNGRTVGVRIYRPKGKASQRALIYMHGGGWTVGSVDTHDPICAGIANETSCTVISVNYSLSPEHRYPHALLDCEAVADWLLENADLLGIDPAMVAIGGDSAGGNLSTALCLKMRDERGVVPFLYQVLIYPSLDTDIDRPSYLRNASAPFLDRPLMIWFLNHYLGDQFSHPDAYAMPMKAQSLAGLPPAFVSTAEFDPLLDEGAEYADRLRQAGVDCIYREAKSLMHGFMRVRGISKLAEIEFQAVCDALRDAFENQESQPQGGL
jgi:acetyl esterase